MRWRLRARRWKLRRQWRAAAAAGCSWRRERGEMGRLGLRAGHARYKGASWCGMSTSPPWTPVAERHVERAHWGAGRWPVGPRLANRGSLPKSWTILLPHAIPRKPCKTSENFLYTKFSYFHKLQIIQRHLWQILNSFWTISSQLPHFQVWPVFNLKQENNITFLLLSTFWTCSVHFHELIL